MENPWTKWRFIAGKIIYKRVIFHGYVSHNQRVKPLVFQQKKGENVVVPSAPNFFAAPRFLALRYGAWVARSSPQRFGLNLIDFFQENVTHSLLSSCSFNGCEVSPVDRLIGLLPSMQIWSGTLHLEKTGYTLLVQCLQNWNISKLCREKQQTASWQMYIYMFI